MSKRSSLRVVEDPCDAPRVEVFGVTRRRDESGHGPSDPRSAARGKRMSDGPPPVSFEDSAADPAEDPAARDDDIPEAEGWAQTPAREEGVAEDHALVRRAQLGEEQAFGELVRRHEQRAWRVARNLVPSDEDAQDLAQEGFVRVFKNLANFDFHYPFTTWLYRIVTNLSIDHLRRRRPTASTTALDEESGDWDLADPNVGSPSDGLEQGEVAVEVRDVLASLAPHFQSVLVLRELEGLPCTEIAKIVGATHVTVRWRLHRGRKLFQEEWERRARVNEAQRGVQLHDAGDVDPLGDDS